MAKSPIPAVILLMLLIFYPIFYMDYAYMDEAHQLWHNSDGSNFTMQVSHGRYLTGWLMERLFGQTSTIADLKYLRIFSLAGWLLVVLIYTFLFRKWSVILALEKQMVWVMNIFMACTLSIAVYIGWASCLQLFLAFGSGLMSGHLLFSHLTSRSSKGKAFVIFNYSLVFFTAIVSLFLYQTAFGAFLLPFFFYLVKNKFQRPGKILLTGVVVYISANLLYFLLFKYSITQADIAGSDRSTLTFNILPKLSFFISKVLSQAFSFNFPYNFKGVFSQAFYPVMFLLWVFSVFHNYKTTLSQKLFYIGKILFLLILIYLPLMVSSESFASYRTMQALTLAGCFLLIDACLSFLHSPKAKWIFTVAACLIFSGMAFYNFRYNFITPLRDEYRAVKIYFDNNYNPAVTKLYIVRPQQYLFKKTNGVTTYQDEFGLPSTYKDWTPEPLFRQMIYEKSGSRQLAAQIEIIQHARKDDMIVPASDSIKGLLIDIDAIVSAYKK